MGNFVLVHGGWHGGWCWRKVVPLLRGAGHEVYTPTLTGLGERAHLANPDVGLDTHIQDVVGLLEYENLHDVVLVGHSLAGGVISGVADRFAERIAHLVYLDASVLRDGECDLDAVRPEERAWLETRVRTEGGWMVAPPKKNHPFGVTDETDANWVNSRLTPHPLRAFTDRLYLSNRAGFPGRRTYIFCTAGTEGMESSPSVDRARTEPGWRFLELDAAHDAMVTAPQELSNLLLSLS
jgi:pimeloyl-ACP methyl ester carboxylesterase